MKTKRATEGRWRKLGWWGARITVPEHWEPARLGTRYLLLEDGRANVFEARWEPVGRRTDPEGVLDRLARARGMTRSLVQERLNPRWAMAVRAFDAATGFSWSYDGQSGKGAVLLCGQCGHMILLQFLGGANVSEETAARVLSSFTDHAGGDAVPWTVFDVSAHMPADFTLLRHRFHPGQFEMVFAHGRDTWTLHRWGPADALLAGRDLVGWSGGIVPRLCEVRGDPATRDTTANSVEWEACPGMDAFDQLRGRLSLKPTHFWCHIWRVPEKNRILCVSYTGKGAHDPALAERICDGYAAR
ncbi:MAG: hypothetical protein ACLFOY_17090 [Desulfatibacillaceae bacterium]